jgi:xanthosine utilization system XapX-like protein
MNTGIAVRKGMFSHIKLQTAAGTVLTVAGLVGILISFQVQKSDIDPTALMIAFVSISVSIIGISLIIENPASPKNDASESNNKLNEHR